MTEIIKEGDNLPDMAIKAIVKDEIKDAKLSTLFADVIVAFTVLCILLSIIFIQFKISFSGNKL